MVSVKGRPTVWSSSPARTRVSCRGKKGSASTFTLVTEVSSDLRGEPCLEGVAGWVSHLPPIEQSGKEWQERTADETAPSVRKEQQTETGQERLSKARKAWGGGQECRGLMSLSTVVKVIRKASKRAWNSRGVIGLGLGQKAGEGEEDADWNLREKAERG